MSFSNLKRNRTQISSLVAAAENAGGGQKKNYGDDRMWKPTIDKAGNGYAVIRFLPEREGQDLPWVQYWDHGFKGPTGQWYIEKSRTSIQEDDPVGELNTILWNQEEGDNTPGKKQARDQKRRLHYVVNILVVSDPGNPDNEGKVFLYQFGKKIFDKIMDIMQPQFEDEEAINPFDMWKGADFKLKIRKVEGYRNYDKSEFASPTPIEGDDSVLEGYYNSMYDLSEFTDPANYKSYDELKKKLDRVLGRSTTPMTTSQEASLDEKVDAPEEKEMSAPLDAADMEDDDTLSYFKTLAAED